MRTKVVCYDLSKEDKEDIISRLFGENYSADNGYDYGRYCGYIDGILCEVRFCIFMFSVRVRDELIPKPTSRVKWANMLFRKMFQGDKKVNIRLNKQHDFNRYSYVEVFYDREEVAFCFRYKPID